MPAGCCAGSHCSCQIVTEGRIISTGPVSLVIRSCSIWRLSSSPAQNETFDTLASGSGVADDPWIIETRYAATAKLDHLPDVNVPTPTNGQVLSWNSSTVEVGGDGSDGGADGGGAA